MAKIVTYPVGEEILSPLMPISYAHFRGPLKEGKGYLVVFKFHKDDLKTRPELAEFVQSMNASVSPQHHVKAVPSEPDMFMIIFRNKEREIPTGDAAGNEVLADAIAGNRVGEGSEGRVKFAVVQTKMGKFRYIRQLQLTKVERFDASKLDGGTSSHSIVNFEPIDGSFKVGDVTAGDKELADLLA